MEELLPVEEGEFLKINSKPNIKTKSQLTSIWNEANKTKQATKPAVSTADDLASSISKAKASGQSFDEWVKGQRETLYHGTPVKFLPENIKPTKGTQGTGIYLDLKKETATRYAKGGEVFEFSGQNLKLADSTKFTKEQSQQFSEAYEKTVKQLGEHSDEATNMAYKSMGFDGKKITDTEIMLFDNSKIKTRSQLKAAWDKVPSATKRINLAPVIAKAKTD